MTFKQFIADAKVRNDAAGDFISDARADPNFPTITSWAALETYLENRNACPDAFVAARDVWKRYGAAIRRNTRKRPSFVADAIDAAVAAIAAKRTDSRLLVMECYCVNQRCPAREVTIRIKDYDDPLVPLVRDHGLPCPCCAQSLKTHWVRTLEEHCIEEDCRARASVNRQLYIRDHGGVGFVPASVFCDETLPAQPYQPRERGNNAPPQPPGQRKDGD